MGKFLKGQDVKFKEVDGNTYTNLLAKETSCSLTFNVNTVDASSKSDDNPEYENAEFDNTELSASIEGNVNDATEAKTLLYKAAKDTGGTYSVMAQLGEHDATGTPSLTTIMIGSDGGAVITSLEIDMPAEGLATVSCSIECGSDFSIN